MKQLKWIIGGLLLAIVPVLALVNVAQAQRFARTVDDGQKVYSSLYSSGRDIDIKGEVFGDIFCAGQTITINATVHGDVICAGQDVTVAGKVDGNIRVAGQVVSIEAETTRNVTVAAATFSLDANASVGQDLTATGGLNIKGTISRDAIISGDSIILNGTIGRNVTAKSSNITLKNDATVAGNLNYTGSAQPKLDKGAAVEGKTTQTATKKERRSFFNPIFYLVALVGLLLIGVVLAFLFPKHLERTTGHIKAKPTRTLLVGVAASLLVPALAFGFALTIVGIPMTIFLLMAFFFAAALSGPVAGYLVGRLVLSKSNNPVTVALVGGLIVVTAYFIPFAGIFFIMAAFWFGFGALLTDLYAHSRYAAATVKK